jgi:phosphoglycerol transferase MdoB-like AlkP superfamily enzyme
VGAGAVSARETVRAQLPGLRRTALLALACNLALEAAQLVTVDGYPWRFKTAAYPLMFLLGTLVVWAVVGLVHAVAGRFAVTAAVMAGLTAALAFADHEKVRLLREPVYPADWRFLRQWRFLLEIVGVRLALALTAGLVLAALAARWWGRRWVRRRGRVARAARWTSWQVRLGTALACSLVLAYVGQFNSPGNVARTAYDALGATWRPWSQNRNYLGNGFVGGFLYNTPVGTMPPPAGYDRAEMARIAARWTAVARRIDRARSVGRLDHLNVVLLLDESFSDPERLAGVHVAADPIPFTRSLMATTTSGQLLALAVGGGTANVEFEALTGMSMALFPPQFRVPYQALVPGYASFPSVVGWLRGRGHATLAIHPFSTEMYRRREVYRSFGIERFVHDTTMAERSRSGHGGYIRDAAAFHELESRLVAEPAPLLVNLVTMQNHLPYEGRYDDPLTVTGPGGQPLDDAGQYARGLAISDAAVADLIGWLRDFDEPTVVAFYGDHLPSVYPPGVFERTGPRGMHETPFFVWSNVAGRTAPQPLTSPTHLVDLALERTGAAVPPYYALLQEVRRRLPAMANGRMYDAHGRPVRPAGLSTADAALLRDYRMVQYDLSVGERWSEQAMFTVPPAGR